MKSMFQTRQGHQDKAGDAHPVTEYWSKVTPTMEQLTRQQRKALCGEDLDVALSSMGPLQRSRIERAAQALVGRFGNRQQPAYATH